MSYLYYIQKRQALQPAFLTENESQTLYCLLYYFASSSTTVDHSILGLGY